MIGKNTSKDWFVQRYIMVSLYEVTAKFIDTPFEMMELLIFSRPTVIFAQS